MMGRRGGTEDSLETGRQRGERGATESWGRAWPLHRTPHRKERSEKDVGAEKGLRQR